MHFSLLRAPNQGVKICHAEESKRKIRLNTNRIQNRISHISAISANIDDVSNIDILNRDSKHAAFELFSGKLLIGACFFFTQFFILEPNEKVNHIIDTRSLHESTRGSHGEAV